MGGLLKKMLMILVFVGLCSSLVFAQIEGGLFTDGYILEKSGAVFVLDEYDEGLDDFVENTYYIIPETQYIQVEGVDQIELDDEVDIVYLLGEGGKRNVVSLTRVVMEEWGSDETMEGEYESESEMPDDNLSWEEKSEEVEE